MHAIAAALLAAAPFAAGQSSESHDAAHWVTISIFFAVFFLFFFMLLAVACLRVFHPALAGEGAGAGASPPDQSRGGQKGLGAEAIAAFPLVFYREVKSHRVLGARDGDGDRALECSVCLLEFQDDDALRLLPTCPHVFHTECIGLWLEEHATCPLCRASLLEDPAPQPLAEAQEAPDSSPDHSTVVLIGDAGDRVEEEEDLSRIQCLARNRRVAGRQALPRSNSTGHGGVADDSSGLERFALRLPEHVRREILMSHRLRHVTSAVESVGVREDSAHGSTVGGSARGAVARLLSRIAPGVWWKSEGGDTSFKADAEGVSSYCRRENSSRGDVGEEKRSV